MLLSEEDMFSWVTEMAFEVYWRRFWTAPSVAAADETLSIAVVMLSRAPVAPRLNTAVEVLTLLQLNPSALVRLPRTSANETASVSLLAEPTWKVTLAPPV